MLATWRHTTESVYFLQHSTHLSYDSIQGPCIFKFQQHWCRIISCLLWDQAISNLSAHRNENNLFLYHFRTIVSDPFENHYHKVENFESLNGILQSLITGNCVKVTTTTVSTTPTTTPIPPPPTTPTPAPPTTPAPTTKKPAPTKTGMLDLVRGWVLFLIDEMNN